MLQIAINNFLEAPKMFHKNYEVLKKMEKCVKKKRKDFKEASKHLRDAEKAVKVSKKRMDQSVHICNQYKLKITNLEIKIKSSYHEAELKQIEKEEKKTQKQVQKEKRKNTEYYSEEILKKTSKLPEEVRRIISEYLPYNVRAVLIQEKSKSIITSFKGIEKNNVHTHFMFISFLDRIATDPEFLHLLTREEAREQIPFLTLYDERKQYTYCGNAYNLKILKNKILWAMEMSKIQNPKFAYKIMKMIIILGEPNKYKRIFDMPTKTELTIEDLPEEYR
jgi:hypothetical protein